MKHYFYHGVVHMDEGRFHQFDGIHVAADDVPPRIITATIRQNMHDMACEARVAESDEPFTVLAAEIITFNLVSQDPVVKKEPKRETVWTWLRDLFRS